MTRSDILGKIILGGLEPSSCSIISVDGKFMSLLVELSAKATVFFTRACVGILDVSDLSPLDFSSFTVLAFFPLGDLTLGDTTFGADKLFLLERFFVSFSISSSSESLDSSRTLFLSLILEESELCIAFTMVFCFFDLVH